MLGLSLIKAWLRRQTVLSLPGEDSCFSVSLTQYHRLWSPGFRCGGVPAFLSEDPRTSQP